MNYNKGFTMIELMMVVVVIGILAAIAIVQYSSQQAAAKTSEVAPMFAEIKKSQYAYKAEYGQFLSTGSSESDLYPVLLGSGEPKKKDWNPSTSSNWYKLGVSPQTNQVYCGYVTMAGSAGTAPSGTWGSELFSAGTPQKPWFYLVAQCDLDGTPGTNTTFITSSELSDVQKKHSGN
ncbi:MAG: prepilin-type N-terminal cleavage/methylation domain-containing protein [Deltaproteobacteria bacterium]|nr:prepilin-type N-terminal cleavage/methylation domain-containing protein [Deltaproteobacteria bacterium]